MRLGRGAPDAGAARRLAALSLGAWQRRPELADRVHRILRRTPGLKPAMAKALVAFVVFGLAAGSIEFARCPQLVAFVARPALTRAEIAGAASAPGSAAMPTGKTAGVGEKLEKQPQILRLRLAGKRPNSAQDDRLNKNAAVAETAADSSTDILFRKNQSAQSAAQQWMVLSAWVQTLPADAAANFGGDAEDSLGDIVVQPDNPDSHSTPTARPALPAALPLRDLGIFWGRFLTANSLFVGVYAPRDANMVASLSTRFRCHRLHEGSASTYQLPAISYEGFNQSSLQVARYHDRSKIRYGFGL